MNYGTVEEYLQKGLHISREMIDLLQDWYLE